jgi:hypothetical protein
MPDAGGPVSLRRGGTPGVVVEGSHFMDLGAFHRSGVSPSVSGMSFLALLGAAGTSCSDQVCRAPESTDHGGAYPRPAGPGAPGLSDVRLDPAGARAPRGPVSFQQDPALQDSTPLTTVPVLARATTLPGDPHEETTTTYRRRPQEVSQAGDPRVAVPASISGRANPTAIFGHAHEAQARHAEALTAECPPCGARVCGNGLSAGMRTSSPGDADTTPGQIPTITVRGETSDQIVAPGADRPKTAAFVRAIDNGVKPVRPAKPGGFPGPSTTGMAPIDLETAWLSMAVSYAPVSEDTASRGPAEPGRPPGSSPKGTVPVVPQARLPRALSLQQDAASGGLRPQTPPPGARSTTSPMPETPRPVAVGMPSPGPQAARMVPLPSIPSGLTALRMRWRLDGSRDGAGRDVESVELPADDPEIGARLRTYLEAPPRPGAAVRVESGSVETRRVDPVGDVPGKVSAGTRVDSGADSPDADAPPGHARMETPRPTQGERPMVSVDQDGSARIAATKPVGTHAATEPRVAQEVQVAVGGADARPVGGEKPSWNEVPPDAAGTARAENTAGMGMAAEYPPGEDTDRRYANWHMRDGVTADKEPVAEKSAFENPSFDSASPVRTGIWQESHTWQEDGLGRVIDSLAGRIFASVVERIEAIGPAKGRARFEFETDEGQAVRVRLTVENNVVSARIDVPSEQMRDLLAGRVWQLNHRLENQGFIPSDIAFCFAGGRDQTADHGARPGLHGGISGTAPGENMEHLTMVESEAYAFESWA